MTLLTVSWDQECRKLGLGGEPLLSAGDAHVRPDAGHLTDADQEPAQGRSVEHPELLESGWPQNCDDG